jgi:formate/nitrite transporter FocA (FNT family)
MSVLFAVIAGIIIGGSLMFLLLYWVLNNSFSGPKF